MHHYATLHIIKSRPILLHLTSPSDVYYKPDAEYVYLLLHFGRVLPTTIFSLH
jgi:hypothetical protein